jgi:hypothetical protein
LVVASRRSGWGKGTQASENVGPFLLGNLASLLSAAIFNPVMASAPQFRHFPPWETNVAEGLRATPQLGQWLLRVKVRAERKVKKQRVAPEETLMNFLRLKTFSSLGLADDLIDVSDLSFMA